MSEGADEVVASAGEYSLSAASLSRLLESLSASERRRLRQNPESAAVLVRGELGREALYENACVEGFDQEPDVAAAGERARRHAVALRYLARQVGSVTLPSEAELKAEFERLNGAYRFGARYRLAQIFLSVVDRDVAQVETEALGIAQRLRSGEADFAELARTHSDHAASAEAGGELDWVDEKGLRPELRSVVTKMAPGSTSLPVYTAEGLHIVRLLERQAERPADFEQVKNDLAGRLCRQAAEQRRQTTVAAALGQQAVEVNQIALNRLLRETDDGDERLGTPPVPETGIVAADAEDSTEEA